MPSAHAPRSRPCSSSAVPQTPPPRGLRIDTIECSTARQPGATLCGRLSSSARRATYDSVREVGASRTPTGAKLTPSSNTTPRRDHRPLPNPRVSASRGGSGPSDQKQGPMPTGLPVEHDGGQHRRLGPVRSTSPSARVQRTCERRRVARRRSRQGGRTRRPTQPNGCHRGSR